MYNVLQLQIHESYCEVNFMLILLIQISKETSVYILIAQIIKILPNCSAMKICNRGSCKFFSDRFKKHASHHI